MFKKQEEKALSQTIIFAIGIDMKKKSARDHFCSKRSKFENIDDQTLSESARLLAVDVVVDADVAE